MSTSRPAKPEPSGASPALRVGGVGASPDRRPFVVDSRPFCVWAHDIRAVNETFLRGIDAGFFAHAVDVHQPLLDTASGQHAAASLRVAYAHALETLFALLCTAVQAPHCPMGWLTGYHNPDLRAVVGKIDRAEPVLSALMVDDAGWEGLASAMFGDAADKTFAERASRGFGGLWRRLAGEILSDEVREEYNSVKHGMRAQMGGFHLAVGIEETFGAGAKTMLPVGSSKFGSSYYVTQPVADDKRNVQLVHRGMNWNPDSVASAIMLIVVSIENVVSFLRWLNGAPKEDLRLRMPPDDATFDLPWSDLPTVPSIEFKFGLDTTTFAAMSKESIIASYPGCWPRESTTPT